MNLKKSSIFVSLGSLFVYAFSFLNQVLIARTFGAGQRMDAYLAGINIPGAVTNVVGATFTFALVPILVKESLQEGASRKRIGGVFVGFGGLGIVAILLGLMFHVLPLSQSSRFGDFQREATFAATLSWIAGGLFFLTALSDALFNASKRFLVAVFGYLPAYLLAAVCCLWLGPKMGGAAVALGTLCGYLALIPYRLIKQKEFVSGGVDLSLFKSVIQQAPLMVIALLMLFGFPVIDSYVAPRVGEGTLSILGYSTRLLSTLAVVIGMGPFGVMVPELARLSSENDRAGFAKRWSSLCRYCFALVFPVVIWMVAFRLEIIQVLFQRGKFGLEQSLDLSKLMLYTIPGSVFMILGMLMVRILFADGKLKTAAILSIGGLAFYLVTTLILSKPWGLDGFGVAYVGSWLAYAVFALGFLVRQDQHLISLRENMIFIGKTMLVAIVFLIIVLVGHKLSQSLGLAPRLAVAAFVFPISLVTYFALGAKLGIYELARLGSTISGRLLRSRSA
jgi:putative peptidoglycan lipid II flippase